MEGDRHADTTCLGAGALELYDHLCPVNAERYNHTQGAIQLRTIGGALAFGHPFTSQRYHMVFNQSIGMS